MRRFLFMLLLLVGLYFLALFGLVFWTAAVAVIFYGAETMSLTVAYPVFLLGIALGIYCLFSICKTKDWTG